jgi:hypothetical protein
MKKWILWIPIVGTILIITDSIRGYNWLDYECYPDSLWGRASLGPWHGMTTGYPIVLLIIYLL